jgi:hypothetical protein
LTVGLLPVQEEIRATRYYSLPSALSDVRGIVGLFFGTSILSLYEDIELKIFREVNSGVGFKRRRKFQSQDNQQTCMYSYFHNSHTSVQKEHIPYMKIVIKIPSILPLLTLEFNSVA